MPRISRPLAGTRYVVTYQFCVRFTNDSQAALGMTGDASDYGDLAAWVGTFWENHGPEDDA
jgi:hypothetical protein